MMCSPGSPPPTHPPPRFLAGSAKPVHVHTHTHPFFPIVDVDVVLWGLDALALAPGLGLNK